MSRRHYVYYRLAEDQAAAVTGIVRAAQAALCAARPGLQAELLRRPEVADGRLTFMEVYAGVPVDAELGAAIEARLAAALSGRIDGLRHVEVFDPLS